MRRCGWHILMAGLILTLTTGCPVVSNLPAPGRILEQKAAETGQDYYVYVPSHYTAERLWPVVITCHGTRPYDTAPAQLAEWKGLAEQKNFLLIVPELKGTVGDFVPSLAEQIRRQMEDEATILSALRSVSAAYSVDPSRVFLTGWSAGGFAVLFTGLRHPEIFRALSLRQTNFNPAFVEPCVPFLDRTQPIQVTYGSLDPLRDHAIKCIEWLRSHEFEPATVERAGTHRRDPVPVYNFFVHVVRHQPWVRIRVKNDPDDPMRLSFSVQTSFDPVNYLWDFGDGTERSPVAAPEHRYEKPGQYNVRVGVWQTEKNRYVRQIQVRVPRVRLGVAPAQAEE
ncbi:MAG TPA: PKD domain-containing protein [Phycisphaerae bacterium]|nr:PKD domain-containing protein [Phycisphaerae bacterium]HOJ75148.1 PKD domain-containing protein [Phycisphaerae bacterium]HOM52378.1 PKD domain-containing protein [Phycisphaerae bacterium]HOQ85163.1 PKD domain-containing protein [Phycisphaerae bacterium]HPP27449.1 PKD domain-containing protein [Phycisphaerae bacterium]